MKLSLFDFMFMAVVAFIVFGTNIGTQNKVARIHSTQMMHSKILYDIQHDVCEAQHDNRPKR